MAKAESSVFIFLLLLHGIVEVFF